ncbi:MAG TPA: hypothetical protein VHY09_00410 [Candidatus Methylacidiphilales bacterium]|jgi:hypothetical protein|nr:hypothetical protein [Candidatus Methylacidiphilales bacterium]
MDTPGYPYENPPQFHHPRVREDLEKRALWIAHSEGRTEITQLDRIRAERELRLAATES